MLHQPPDLPVAGRLLLTARSAGCGSAYFRRQAYLNALTTPDGRYLIVRGRLWRSTNPSLPAEVRTALVGDLMDARREVKAAARQQDVDRLAAARIAVNAAKIALGERGPVWWTDGATDFNRYLAKNTPYAKWYAGLDVP